MSDAEGLAIVNELCARHRLQAEGDLYWAGVPASVDDATLASATAFAHTQSRGAADCVGVLCRAGVQDTATLAAAALSRVRCQTIDDAAAIAQHFGFEVAVIVARHRHDPVVAGVSSKLVHLAAMIVCMQRPNCTRGEMRWRRREARKCAGIVTALDAEAARLYAATGFGDDGGVDADIRAYLGRKKTHYAVAHACDFIVMAATAGALCMLASYLFL